MPFLQRKVDQVKSVAMDNIRKSIVFVYAAVYSGPESVFAEQAIARGEQLDELDVKCAVFVSIHLCRDMCSCSEMCRKRLVLSSRMLKQ